MAVLYGLAKIFKGIRLALRARRGGYRIHQDGTGEIWVRKSEEWSKWWRRVRGEQTEFEVEEIDEGTPTRGWNWWAAGKRARGGVHDARTPLLNP